MNNINSAHKEKRNMPSDTKVRLYVSKAGSLPGYHVEDDEKTRHRALRACLRKPGADARAVKRRLNVLRIYRKNSRSLRARADALAPVSYTHLTLPTIVGV